MAKLQRALRLLAFLTLTHIALCQDVTLDVNWESFLARSDLVWSWAKGTRAPSRWMEAAFIGNGNIGALIGPQWGSPAQPTTTLLFNVSRTDVYDVRRPGSRYALNNFVFDRPRLPIGAFRLQTVGELVRASMRQYLWNAEVACVMNTTRGSLTVRALAHSDLDVFVIEISTTGDESGAKLSYQPKDASSTW